MDDAQSLCHTKWDCKYHIVWIPKCRRKVLFGRIRKHLADLFHSLARQKECKILEGHLQPDHIHILSKSASHIARMYLGQKKNYSGMHFWARGYYASTVGADEEVIANYIRGQEDEDKRLDQLALLTEV